MKAVAGAAAVVPVTLGGLYVTTDVRHSHGIASEESSAIGGLMQILAGQIQFYREPRYGSGRRVFANPHDGRGYVDLFETPRGERLALINESVAKARHGGEPHFGYYYYSLWGDADGQPYDPAIEFAVCAVPARFSVTGRNMFVMDTGGIVYQALPSQVWPGIGRGDRVPPLRTFPSAAELAKNWIAVGNG